MLHRDRPPATENSSELDLPYLARSGSYVAVQRKALQGQEQSFNAAGYVVWLSSLATDSTLMYGHSYG